MPNCRGLASRRKLDRTTVILLLELLWPELYSTADHILMGKGLVDGDDFVLSTSRVGRMHCHMG